METSKTTGWYSRISHKQTKNMFYFQTFNKNRLAKTLTSQLHSSMVAVKNQALSTYFSGLMELARVIFLCKDRELHQFMLLNSVLHSCSMQTKISHCRERFMLHWPRLPHFLWLLLCDKLHYDSHNQTHCNCRSSFVFSRWFVSKKEQSHSSHGPVIETFALLLRMVKNWD